jgi:hypothetical protein
MCERTKGSTEDMNINDVHVVKEMNGRNVKI